MYKWFDIKAMAHGKAEIYIYGEIGENMWGEGTSAKDFARELKALGDVTTIDVRVNSLGGNVNDGQAIYSLLKAHKATINMHIDGIAASIATLIVMAGDHVFMPTNAFFCPHGPAAHTEGRPTSDAHRETAEKLDKYRANMAEAYAAKTGQDKTAMFEFLNEESLLTAEEALDYGFVDEISAAFEIAAKLDDLDDKKKIEAILANKKLEQPIKKTDPTPTPNPVVAALTAMAVAMGMDYKALVADIKKLEPEPKAIKGADVVAIIESCTAAGYSEFAAEFIKQEKSLDDVKAIMETVAEIKDLCVAAGKPDLTNILAKAGCFSVDAVREILLEVKAGDDDDDIDNKHHKTHLNSQAKVDAGWDSALKDARGVKLKSVK